MGFPYTFPFQFEGEEIVTTTLLSLDQKLLEETGDWIQGTVSTAISNTNSVVANVTFPEIRSTADYFNNFWIYFDDYANIGEERLIKDDDGTNTLTVLGGNLTTDVANTATFRLSKYSKFSERAKAISVALEEMYPSMYAAVDNRDLITGNILPTFRWATNASLDIWAATNGSVARTTTAGLVRGESADSCLLTATAANAYVSCHSDKYRRLLDLQGDTVDASAWVYPSVANDATVVIYTLSNDGTTSTTNSSVTNCAASQWTKLELNNVSIGNDLADIDIRVNIATNAATCYVSRPIVTGHNVYEYLLPKDFDNGSISEVYIQTSGEATNPADDLHPRFYNKIYGWEIIDDGTYKYLRLPYLFASPYQIRLLGKKPIPTVSSGTDTVTLESHHLRPLIHYAAYNLFDTKSTRVSSEDKDRYIQMAGKHYGQYQMLMGSHSQVQPSPQLNIRM